MCCLPLELWHMVGYFGGKWTPLLTSGYWSEEQNEEFREGDGYL